MRKGSTGGMRAVDYNDSTEDAPASAIEWVKQWPHVHKQLVAFMTKLKRRQLNGSYDVAKRTMELLRNMMGTCRWGTAGQLMEYVRAVGKLLSDAQPRELAIGNITRRVLFIIREEYLRQSTTQGNEDTPSVEDTKVGFTEVNAGIQHSPSLLTSLGPSLKDTSFSRKLKGFRQTLLEGINELVEELDNLHEPIVEQALEHIHANEIMLTYGKSETVEEFFKAARKKREFKVIVAESAPMFEGQEMAHTLATNNIDTTVITDSAIFAMMARVNKVVIPAHAVMANGGLITSAGGHMIALAAKQHRVPLVCVTGLYKLCPLYPHDQDTFNDLGSPNPVLNFEEGDNFMDQVDVVNNEYDYVPPELVDLLITNMGGHQPSYIYRLLQDHYSPEDTYL